MPYILDRIMVRGLMAAMANPSPTDKAQSPWARRLMAAHVNAVENLVIFASLVLTARALSITTTVTVYRFRVRALFLVTPCACRGLYARHSGASYAILCRRFRCTGGVGAGDF